MSKSNESAFMHKMRGFFMGRLGYEWLPGREIAIVLRDEVFHRIERGGRYIYIAPGVERIAYTIEVLPEMHRFTANNIQTLDGIGVTVTLKVEYRLDPFIVPEADQPKVAGRCRYSDSRREVMQDQGQRALQEVVSNYAAVDVLKRGITWKIVEEKLWQSYSRLIKPFGLTLLVERCSIQEVLPPPALAQRLEASVQRRIANESLDNYKQNYNDLLRGEAIESLSGMSSGSPYLSVPDLTDPVSSKSNQPAQLGPKTEAPEETTPADDTLPTNDPKKSGTSPDTRSMIDP
jgi:hypothetical protein